MIVIVTRLVIVVVVLFQLLNVSDSYYSKLNRYQSLGRVRLLESLSSQSCKNEQQINSYTRKQVIVSSISLLSLTTLFVNSANAININKALSSFDKDNVLIVNTTTVTATNTTLNDYLISKKRFENVDPMTHGVNK